jgi:hypothetical protein
VQKQGSRCSQVGKKNYESRRVAQEAYYPQTGRSKKHTTGWSIPTYVCVRVYPNVHVDSTLMTLL